MEILVRFILKVCQNIYNDKMLGRSGIDEQNAYTSAIPFKNAFVSFFACYG